MAAAVLLLLAPAAFADPVTFTVNSAGDQPDPDVGNDGCDVGGGVCTLRAAIQEANFNTPQADTINFSGVSGQIVLTNALPTITDSVTVNGPGADQLAIDGDNTYRVLEAQNGTTTTIKGLTIRGGQAPVTGGTFAGGGGIMSGGDMTLDHVVVTDNHASVSGASGASVEAAGAGIEAGGGVLTLISSTVRNNDANAVASGAGSAVSYGGGIWAPGGTLHIARSTIYNNQANASVNSGTGTSTAWPAGGGIYTLDAALTINQSTITNNSVTSAGATHPNVANYSAGGGIYQDNGSSLTVTGATISDNSVATPAGANDFGQGANLELLSGGTFRDTIVAEPVGAQNCVGTFISNGYNLEDDDTHQCNFNQTTDIAGQNPMLAAPADNGGPTLTQALPANSPAIDKGKSFGATTDQRGTGFPRISNSPTIPNAGGGDGSDIGSFERDSVPPSKPVFAASTPKPPANNNQPKLHGVADAGSFVRIYKTTGCTGKPVANGFAGQFKSPGIGVSVPDDSTTVFHATAGDSFGNRSACSNGYTYREDSTRPITSIDSVTVNRSLHQATVGFSANESESTFRCRIDGSALSPCTSPKTFTGLSAGSHTVRVVARDRAGNVDATPASRTFTL
ncbi:MAG: choice-of-anchor Q domain-containing protein [Solirubrobacterales bacterium]